MNDDNNFLTQSEERNLRYAAMVIDDISEAEFQAAINNTSIPEPSEKALEQLDIAFYSEMHKLETDVARKNNKKRLIRWLATAATLLFVFIPLSAITVYANREKVANFLIQNYEEYSVIQYDSNNQAEKPYGWKSEHYLTWVPENFLYNKVTYSNKTETVWYKNGEKEICFSVSSVINNSEFDTEEYTKENLTVNGQQIIIFTSKDYTKRRAIFTLSETFIDISGNLSENQILEMCKKIKK